jgi:putative membrane protein
LTILTLGLFLIVINAMMLGLTDLIANLFDEIRFSVEDVGSALLGALIITLVSIFLSMFTDPDRLATDFGGGRRWR